MDKLLFINIEDEERDLILSFAFHDDRLGVKSLILQRTPSFEFALPDYERGVKVSMEGGAEYDDNLLQKVEINNGFLHLSAQHESYNIDISKLSEEDISDMIEIIHKLNFDANFTVNIT